MPEQPVFPYKWKALTFVSQSHSAQSRWIDTSENLSRDFTPVSFSQGVNCHINHFIICSINHEGGGFRPCVTLPPWVFVIIRHIESIMPLEVSLEPFPHDVSKKHKSMQNYSKPIIGCLNLLILQCLFACGYIKELRPKIRSLNKSACYHAVTITTSKTVDNSFHIKISGRETDSFSIPAG